MPEISLHPFSVIIHVHSMNDILKKDDKTFNLIFGKYLAFVYLYDGIVDVCMN